MTTIGSVPSLSMPQHNAGPDQHAAGDEFAAQYDLPPESVTLTDRLGELTEALEALQRQHLRMSNTQYLLARFALQEQITVERQWTGEDIGTIGIRLEGRTFGVAGTRLNPDSLEIAELPADAMVQVATPGSG